MQGINSASCPQSLLLTSHKALIWSNVANSWGDGIALLMILTLSNLPQITWTWLPEKPLCADCLFMHHFLRIPHAPSMAISILHLVTGQHHHPTIWTFSISLTWKWHTSKAITSSQGRL